jgi:hypothetical protein
MRRPWRPIAAVALAALPFGVSGCQSARQKEYIESARAVTTQFAAAHDAGACAMLTGRALVKLYGVRPNQPVSVARAKCARSSAAFQGEPVKITDAELIDDRTIKVSAMNEDGTFTYAVTVRRPRDRWLVDEVSQYRVR